MDYKWKADDVFFEDPYIPGPTNPAQTVCKSLTELLSGEHRSADLTEQLEDLYKMGLGLLVVVNELNLLSPKDNTASVGSQEDFIKISRTFTHLGAREIIELKDVGHGEMITGLKAAAQKAAGPEICWVGVFVLSHGSEIQGWDTPQ